MLSLGSVTFFVFGIVLVMLGAHQADLARDLSLDLADSGFLGAVLALGLGAGVVVAGPLSDRLPRGPLFVAATLLTAASLFGVGVSRSYAGIVVLLWLAGLGCGAYDTVINAAVVDRFRQRTTSALALVHSAATLGACVGPAFIAWWSAGTAWPRTFYALAVAHCGLAVWGAFAGLRKAAIDVDSSARFSAAEWLAAPAFIALSIVAFAYVGLESGLTLFAVPWALVRAESESAGQWSISTFWLGLLIGRLSLAVWPPQRALQLLAAAGVIGGAVLALANAITFGPLAAATAIAGIALGPTYPLLITLAAQRFPSASGTAVGLVAGAGASGGFCVPWLIGVLGDAYGLRAALVLLCLHGLVIALAALALVRRDAVVASS